MNPTSLKAEQFGRFAKNSVRTARTSRIFKGILRKENIGLSPKRHRQTDAVLTKYYPRKQRVFGRFYGRAVCSECPKHVSLATTNVGTSCTANFPERIDTLYPDSDPSSVHLSRPARPAREVHHCNRIALINARVAIKSIAPARVRYDLVSVAAGYYTIEQTSENYRIIFLNTNMWLEAGVGMDNRVHNQRAGSGTGSGTTTGDNFMDPHGQWNWFEATLLTARRKKETVSNESPTLHNPFRVNPVH